VSGAGSDPLAARLRRLGETRIDAAARAKDPTLARLLGAIEDRGAVQRPARDWLAIAVPAGLAAALVGAALLPPSAADKLLAPSVGAGAAALARLFERVGDPTQ